MAVRTAARRRAPEKEASNAGLRAQGSRDRRAGGEGGTSGEGRDRYGERTRRPQVRTVRVLGNQRLTAGGILKRAKKRQVSPKKRQGD